MRLALTVSCTALALGLAGGARAAQTTPPGETLTQALSQAYQLNPQLLAQRAHLRATDEGVPQALSGWRPQVTFTGTTGRAEVTGSPTISGTNETKEYIDPSTLDLNVTQPIYTGGRVPALIAEAEHNVIADRARTAATEEQILFNVAQAYLDVVQAQATVELNINNENVLRKQLEATNDEFHVGQVTRTDVAQAESRLSLATANRVQAEGNLQTSRANYQRAVGHLPGRLIAPTEHPQLPGTLDEALTLASQNNPNVILADFSSKAGEDAVRATRAQLAPTISVIGDLNRTQDTARLGQTTNEATIIARLTMPIYEGGNIYSQTRQAKETVTQLRDQLLDARQAAIQQATRDWQTIVAQRANIVALNATIKAAAIALDGVREEARVGSRTILDVLNAEQELFTDRVSLVQGQHDLAVAEFDLTQQIGRLTAQDLKLPVSIYDPEQHYKDVRNKWIGFGSKTSQ
jgi:outer membrane protein